MQTDDNDDNDVLSMRIIAYSSDSVANQIDRPIDVSVIAKSQLERKSPYNDSKSWLIEWVFCAHASEDKTLYKQPNG